MSVPSQIYHVPEHYRRNVTACEQFTNEADNMSTFMRCALYGIGFIVLLFFICLGIYLGVKYSTKDESFQNSTTSALPIRNTIISTPFLQKNTVSTPLVQNNAMPLSTPAIQNDTVLPEIHRLIYREEWGGRPMKGNTIPLMHPTPLVIITHTAGQFCNTSEKCAAKVNSIQNYHVQELGAPDAGYNFLIGGDANIYVARGWDITNFFSDSSIEICFIGNFNFDELTPGMIEAAQELMAEGVKLGKLSESYTLVCHNQTFATSSPGVNVYKEVKMWPHWKPGTFF